MARFLRKLYSPIVSDGIFTVAAAAGVWGIIVSGGIPVPVVEVAADPLVKAMWILGITVAALLFAILAVRFDHCAADDYIFRALTMSAYVGQYTFAFTIGAWAVLVEPKMGGFPMMAVLCLWLLSWALGYLYVRLRGTGASA